MSGRRESTSLGSSDLHNIWVRGVNLVEDVMGKMGFAEFSYFVVTGVRAEPRQIELLNAVLVSMVEHGITPSALVARVTGSLSPAHVQGAVAAGLLGVGDVVLGSMEGAARLLTEIEDEPSPSLEDRVARCVGAWTRRGDRIPGIGHAIHHEGDPRARRLRQIAEDLGFPMEKFDAMDAVSGEASAIVGRVLPVNITGYAASALLLLGIPWHVQRGFALMARVPGLVAHLADEASRPITPAVRGFLAEIQSADDRGRSGSAEDRDGGPNA